MDYLNSYGKYIKLKYLAGIEKMNLLYCGNYFEGYNALKKISAEHNVKMVFTDLEEAQNAHIISFCKQEGIELFPSFQINENNLTKKIKDMDIDIIVCNNFKKIIIDKVFQSTKFGGINLHSSLLPQYKGRAPINWAIINGEKNSGITIHFIDETLDGGNIILQKKIPIKYSDTYWSILEKNIQLEPDLLLKSLRKVEQGYRGKPQTNEGSVFPYIARSMRIIDWTTHSTQIYNLIRALVHPFPGAITYSGTNELIIYSAIEKKSNFSGKFVNGEIIAVQKDSVEVFCRPKNIVITALEDAEGQKMNELIIQKNIYKGLIFKNVAIYAPSQ